MLLFLCYGVGLLALGNPELRRYNSCEVSRMWCVLLKQHTTSCASGNSLFPSEECRGYPARGPGTTSKSMSILAHPFSYKLPALYSPTFAV